MSSTLFQVINPEALGAPKGWSNGMLAPAGGRILFVAGQTARGSAGVIVDGGFIAQFGQALDNVLCVVQAAGGDATNIGRMTVFVTNLAAYMEDLRSLGGAYRQRMGHHYPAMALVEVKGLVDEGAMVEIEATAVIAP